MLAVLFILLALVVHGILNAQALTQQNLILYAISVGEAVYVFLLFYVIIPAPSARIRALRWLLAALNGLSVGTLIAFLDQNLHLFVYLVTILSVVITSIAVGRGPAIVMITFTSAIQIAASTIQERTLLGWIETLSMPLIAVVISETVCRLIEVLQANIHRLDIVNDFAQQIASTLDPDQVMALLKAAIPTSLEADTYYVGLLEDGKIRLTLFYDEGQYFPDTIIPMEGTLSGWMLRHRKPLFIPDLRYEPPLDGVAQVIIGKDKTSLAWLGVPMVTSRSVGVIAVASYRPNAFDRNDMELLENLARQAATSLENAYRHAEVERQSRLDSLTGAYNHGYFLKRLQEQMNQAASAGMPLSLIMLDIDYFKHYNDTYGHLFGDKVLEGLTHAIRSHVKSTDSIGRWGGEEFAVALPSASREQALLVARRIQETMSHFQLDHPEKGTIPSPTVSQGIAVFPVETAEIYTLVDLADKRLYVAKNRGRDQVEAEQPPPPEHPEVGSPSA